MHASLVFVSRANPAQIIQGAPMTFICSQVIDGAAVAIADKPDIRAAIDSGTRCVGEITITEITAEPARHRGLFCPRCHARRFASY
jgi:hypothetical protein